MAAHRCFIPLVNHAFEWYNSGMNREHFSACMVSSPLQWLRIFHLYRRVFPRNERKPFSIILSMHRRGKTDVWYLRSGGRFAGFATTINDDDLILLDYLAVTKKMRGRGMGGFFLRQMQKYYAGKGIFVEIESEYESVPNRAERIRRKRFYTENGMRPSCVMARVFGVHMELLCWNCSVDFQRYHAFYRENYSPWAAEHIIEAEYPDVQ